MDQVIFDAVWVVSFVSIGQNAGPVDKSGCDFGQHMLHPQLLQYRADYILLRI